MGGVLGSCHVTRSSLHQVKWREEIEVQFKQMRVEASALPELDDEVQAAKRRDEELKWGEEEGGEGSDGGDGRRGGEGGGWTQGCS